MNTGKFLGGFWFRTAFYLLVGFAWNLLRGQEIEGDVFHLQGTVLGIALNTITLFFLLELPVWFLRSGLMQLGGRPALMRFAALVVPLPMAIGAMLFQFGRFDEVRVAEGKISVRGPSPLADYDFLIEDLGVVYLRETSMTKELVFLWYDKALQSAYVPTSDSSSLAELEGVIQSLEENGVEVPTDRPSGVVDAYFTPVR